MLIYFNPRSLTGATISGTKFKTLIGISIHAPLRERLRFGRRHEQKSAFQSTLPYGSDEGKPVCDEHPEISIHAPLRERLFIDRNIDVLGRNFNPRSLTGATQNNPYKFPIKKISIHAPLRERPLRHLQPTQRQAFQSTLPYGSDAKVSNEHLYFNPRSLTGATNIYNRLMAFTKISIHAPLRERRSKKYSPASI